MRFRPAGGAWGPVATLPGTERYFPQDFRVTLDARGNALVIWDGAGVRANYKPAGAAWRKPTTLCALSSYCWLPDAGFDSHGNAIAVWGSWFQQLGRVRAAIFTRGG